MKDEKTKRVTDWGTQQQCEWLCSHVCISMCESMQLGQHYWYPEQSYVMEVDHDWLKTQQMTHLLITAWQKDTALPPPQYLCIKLHVTFSHIVPPKQQTPKKHSVRFLICEGLIWQSSTWEPNCCEIWIPWGKFSMSDIFFYRSRETTKPAGKQQPLGL